MTIVFAFGTAVRSQTQKPDNLSVRLGNKTIVIPAPEGLQEVGDKFPTVTVTFKASEPPQNDLLAAYVTASDLQSFGRGEQPLMNYYAKISTLKAGREQHVSPALFQAVVAEFRKHTDQYVDPNQPTLKKLIEDFEQELSKLGSVPAKLELGKPKNLGTFNVGPNTHSIVLLSAVKVEAAGRGLSRMILAGASLVHVKNRILFVNSYRTYESEADVETMKESVRKWTNSILAANERD